MSERQRRKQAADSLLEMPTSGQPGIEAVGNLIDFHGQPPLAPPPAPHWPTKTTQTAVRRCEPHKLWRKNNIQVAKNIRTGDACRELGMSLCIAGLMNGRSPIAEIQRSLPPNGSRHGKRLVSIRHLQDRGQGRPSSEPSHPSVDGPMRYVSLEVG